MSQQLVLDLSTASARSKGQALRHQKTALNEDDRKARRKLSRKNRLQQNELRIGNVRSQTGFVPPPGQELVEHQPHSMPILANSSSTGLPTSTQTTIVPPTSDQTMFSVMSMNKSSLDRRAYGQARRYLGNKNWQRAESPVGALLIDAVVVQPAGDQNETRVILEEEDILIDYVRGLEPPDPNPEPSEPAKMAGMDGKNSYEDAHSQKQPILDHALSFIHQIKNRYHHEPEVYNGFLDMMRKFHDGTIDSYGIANWVSRSFADRPEIVQGFNLFLPSRYHVQYNLHSRRKTHDGADLQEQPTLDDALKYIKLVKLRLQHEAGAYKRFLDILHDYESKDLETLGVIDWASCSFASYPELLQGFNIFMPLDYRIECEVRGDLNHIRVITPLGPMAPRLAQKASLGS